MLDIFIDNIFVLFGGQVFQQTIDILLGTNCGPLLADLFLRTYEADELLKNKERNLAKTLNSSFRYMDDVLSLNNSRFGYYLHLIYPNRILLTLKGLLLTLYFTLKSTTEEDKRKKTKLYDKPDDFTFPIVT